MEQVESWGKGLKMSRKECVYCGASGKLTKDHIPPRNLFAKPYPANLITVPSCRPCNNNAAKDDEYLRAVISFRSDAGDLPEVKPLQEATLRAWSDPKRQGLARKIIATTRQVDLKTSSGLFVGKGVTYVPDLRRLENVVSRIVKGLFFHEHGRRLPSAYEVATYSESGFDEADAETRQRLSEWAAATKCQPERKIGGRVLSYWFQAVEDDPDCSRWVLILFGCVGFMSLTLKTELANRIKSARQSETKR